MGKVLNVAAAAAILSAYTTAFAMDAMHRTTGRIKSVDLMSHVITLDDGSTYKIARGVSIKRMKAGEKITLTTSEFGGTLEALAVTPAVD
jgi:Cu/Ag efflux protein CusF